MNRITVVCEDDAIHAQARTYAEYRVFAALARHSRNVRRVRVVLRRMEAGETCDTVACAVTVTLEPSGVLRLRSTGPHVYAAINRAVERLDTQRRLSECAGDFILKRSHHRGSFRADL